MNFELFTSFGAFLKDDCLLLACRNSGAPQG